MAKDPRHADAPLAVFPGLLCQNRITGRGTLVAKCLDTGGLNTPCGDRPRDVIVRCHVDAVTQGFHVVRVPLHTEWFEGVITRKCDDEPNTHADESRVGAHPGDPPHVEVPLIWCVVALG